MVWLGEISYAFYLWHYPIVIGLVGRLTPRISRPGALAVAVVLTAVMAELSRRFVETPVARRRAAWTAHLTGDAHPAPRPEPHPEPSPVPLPEPRRSRAG
jgi:peptidoglycan/LPS O-acetylase OafA/YrhL